MRQERVDENVRQALAALRDLDRGLEAPERVEAALRAKFRRARARRQTVIWCGTAAAVVIVALGFAALRDRTAHSNRIAEGGSVGSLGGGPTTETAQKSAAFIEGEQKTAEAREKDHPKSVVKSLAVARKTVAPEPQEASESAAAPVQPAAASAAETVTDFFPLLQPAPPFERGEILRLSVPASVMRTVGLPVREDRLGEAVQADVLVGEEGFPRAIRFVRTEAH